MSNTLSIPTIVSIGDVSTYLSANYTSKKLLFGGPIIKEIPPIQIAMATDGLRWYYEGGSDPEGLLRNTGNYLYWMCGKFALQAQGIISGPGGGSVIPSSGVSLPNVLDFIVSASSFIATDESSVTISDFIGYNVEFNRGGQPQYTTDPGDGSTYFSWNRVSGLFTLNNGAAQEGERFRIIPIG